MLVPGDTTAPRRCEPNSSAGNTARFDTSIHPSSTFLNGFDSKLHRSYLAEFVSSRLRYRLTSRLSSSRTSVLISKIILKAASGCITPGNVVKHARATAQTLVLVIAPQNRSLEHNFVTSLAQHWSSVRCTSEVLSLHRKCSRSHPAALEIKDHP